MRYIKLLLAGLRSILMGVLRLLDWLILAFTASSRPTTRDAANAEYGLDRRDPLGERLGGPANAKPGERLPPKN